MGGNEKREESPGWLHIQAFELTRRGFVIVPPGDWNCAGPITRLSNVNFHLRSGAQIWFSPNPADYTKHGPYDFGPDGKLVRMRWQGTTVTIFRQ